MPREGTYQSDLIDAGQPAKWGKLQIDADIPRGCKVLVASRSGNVKDVNDPTFSEWTELVEVTEPVQLRCPVGRFCQYKLVLETQDGQKTPLIREIAVASTVPNLAPKVEIGGRQPAREPRQGRRLQDRLQGRRRERGQAASTGWTSAGSDGRPGSR